MTISWGEEKDDVADVERLWREDVEAEADADEVKKVGVTDPLLVIEVGADDNVEVKDDEERGTIEIFSPL